MLASWQEEQSLKATGNWDSCKVCTVGCRDAALLRCRHHCSRWATVSLTCGNIWVQTADSVLSSRKRDQDRPPSAFPGWTVRVRVASQKRDILYYMYLSTFSKPGIYSLNSEFIFCHAHYDLIFKRPVAHFCQWDMLKVLRLLRNMLFI